MAPHIYIWLRARFRRARKPHFFQYVCAMTYYIQAHHATSLHNLPKPHVWQCVCVMQWNLPMQPCNTASPMSLQPSSPCHLVI